MNILAAVSLLSGAVALAITFAYVARVSQLQFSVQRNDYIGLHIFLGVGCAVAALKLLTGSVLDWGSGAAMLSAICHLSVTHIPGKQFEPPAYMQSTRGDL